MTKVDTAETTQAEETGSARQPVAPNPGNRRARVRRAVRRTLGSVARPEPWKRGRVVAALALLLGLIMLLHAQIPDLAGLGSLVETFLPWFGLLGIPVLFVAALWRRSLTAVAALLIPAVVWTSLFGGLFTGTSHEGTSDLTVVSHNVRADNPDPAGTADDLAASGADLLALVEITQQDKGTYEKGLAQEYPYHTVINTVGLWSKLPLSDTQPVDTAMDAGPLGETKSAEEKQESARALRTTVATDAGPVEVYVAHLGSVRVHADGGFTTGQRDDGAQALADAVAADEHERVMVLGDMNGTTDDRAFDALTSEMDSAQEEAGDGFGFSYPAAFPVVRIDQILVRGMETDSSWVLPATASDHLPVAAGVSW
ncbi:endonuclease/exonuclease/phosphatase family protein [Streptomyces fractus]|uniref:endonuclease/exonuclease/phosphatase family protein n=1 Tax=Streptomyces fractus TaxID=641806 RepID=UPI003CF0F519